MNGTSSDIPKILRLHGLRPDKELGQNFLIDTPSLHLIVSTAEISTSDTVLEIGPGLGNLTSMLSARARRVIAVELDQRFIPLLHEVLAQFNNVEIVQGDILKIDPASLVPEPDYLVVANIPYYITSAIIRHLLGSKSIPKRLVLTVQLEVAQRICAQPGEMSLLALSVQVFGKATIAGVIPAEAFYPNPKVDSAVVHVEVFPSPLLLSPSIDLLFRIAKAGFSQKRKTLRNSLSGGLGWSKEKTEQFLSSAGIDPFRRAETLSLEEWIELTQRSEVEN